METDEARNGQGRSNQTKNKPQKTGKNHLLLIGINDYKHVTKLNNAEKDIQDFKKVLYDRYRFFPENTIELLGEDATRGAIFDAFKKLRDAIDEGDNVVIYYSGHGDYDKIEEVGYWIPVGGKHPHESTYFSNADLHSKLTALKKAKHIFLISDSCFSRSLFNRDIVARNLNNNSLNLLEADASRWGLTSGKGLVSDGLPGTNSPFAEVLLDVLRTKNTDFSIGELNQEVKSRITNLRYEQQAQAYPIVQTGHNGGEFIFRLRENDEQAAYDAACKTNTIAAYDLYLEKHAEHADEVHRLKRSLQNEIAERQKREQRAREPKAWELLNEGLDIASVRSKKTALIRTFLQNYPDGAHSTNAQKLLDDIEIEIQKEFHELVQGGVVIETVEEPTPQKREQPLSVSTTPNRTPYYIGGGIIAIVLFFFVYQNYHAARVHDPIVPPIDTHTIVMPPIDVPHTLSEADKKTVNDCIKNAQTEYEGGLPELACTELAKALHIDATNSKAAALKKQYNCK